MEARFQIPDDLLKRIEDEDENTPPEDIINTALELYKWATDQKKNGRIIVLSDHSGNMRELKLKDL